MRAYRTLLFLSVTLAAVGTLGGSLPSGYHALEYIEATGTQYINIDFSVTKKSVMTVDYQSLKKSGDSYQVVVGASNMMGFQLNKDKNPFAASVFCGSSAVSPAFNWAYGDRYVVQLDGATGEVFLGGTLRQTYEATTEPNPNLPVYVFDRNSANSPQGQKATGRLYSLTIVDDGVMERDLVPAYKLATGKAGLFDRQHSVFYPNAAGGADFAYELKPDPADLEYHAYLESDGTGAVDTEIDPETNMVFDIDWTCLSTNSFQVPFGLLGTDTAFVYFSISTSGKNNRLALMTGSYINELDFWAPGVRHMVRLDNAARRASVDGRSVWQSYEKLKEVDGMCCLFARNNRKTKEIDSKATGRLHVFRAYQSGELLHEFVPALWKASYAGLHDRVTGRFYPCADSAFTLGPKWEYGHVQLDSILSRGREYVDTGIEPDTNTVVEVDWTSRKAQGAAFQVPCGVVSPIDNKNQNFELMILGGNGTRVSLFDGNVNMQDWNFGERKVFRLDAPAGVVTIDGQAQTVKTGHPSKMYTAPLFCRNNKGTLDSFARGRLHSARIWQDGRLMRDFIPVERKGDGGYMLYEKVFGMYYENEGEGAFAKDDPGLVLTVR